MANWGDIKTSFDFQVLKQGPIDYRTKKKTKADLINIDSWPHEGNVIYVYPTMIVGVEETGEIYYLKDPSKILSEDYSGWKLIGSGSSTDIDIDTALSLESENPVQNKVITEKINQLEVEIDTKLDYEIVEEIITPEGDIDLSGYATTKWVQEQLDAQLTRIAEIENALLQSLNEE